jgi:hypothetical protein
MRNRIPRREARAHPCSDLSIGLFNLVQLFERVNLDAFFRKSDLPTQLGYSGSFNSLKGDNKQKT